MGKTYKDRRDYLERGGKRGFKKRNPYALELRDNPLYRPRRKEDKRDAIIESLDTKEAKHDEGDFPQTIPIPTRIHDIQD